MTDHARVQPWGVLPGPRAPAVVYSARLPAARWRRCSGHFGRMSASSNSSAANLCGIKGSISRKKLINSSLRSHRPAGSSRQPGKTSCPPYHLTRCLRQKNQWFRPMFTNPSFFLHFGHCPKWSAAGSLCTEPILQPFRKKRGSQAYGKHIQCHCADWPGPRLIVCISFFYCILPDIKPRADDGFLTVSPTRETACCVAGFRRKLFQPHRLAVFQRTAHRYVSGQSPA